MLCWALFGGNSKEMYLEVEMMEKLCANQRFATLGHAAGTLAVETAKASLQSRLG